MNHAFIISYMVYLIGVPAIYAQQQINFFVKIVVLHVIMPNRDFVFQRPFDVSSSMDKSDPSRYALIFTVRIERGSGS